MRWICCQLGAREHYAVPRALRLHHALDSMVTDAWVAPGNVLGNFRRGLRERFHDDLADARVRHSTLRLLTFEAWARIRGLRGWERILARNEWFQQQAAKRLRDYGTAGPGDCVLFGYSYAAKDIFRLAKRRGWRTVLGQIDPGPPEERIVAQLHSENAGPRADGQIAPPVYWEHWREECALADRIVVNSPWSERALIEEGVPPEKLRVVPLAYEPPAEAAGFSRQYPERFTSQRPMRVLFLGQVNVRKGMGPLLEAIRQLLTDRPHPSPLCRLGPPSPLTPLPSDGRGKPEATREGHLPIEFWFVGPIQIQVPEDLRHCPQIRWVGPVARGATASFFRDADVFLFPTFSDGFGLTQLEAQAWRLPVIASKSCGEVVDDGKNGVVLKEVSSGAIAEALRRCLTAPASLRDFSARAVSREQFGLSRIGEAMVGMFG